MSYSLSGNIKGFLIIIFNDNSLIKSNDKYGFKEKKLCTGAFSPVSNMSQWQRVSLDINISAKYVYVRKHTNSKNEIVREIMFCESNENYRVRV